MTSLNGIIPPLCTPLNDDFTVDVASLRRAIDFQLAVGVHGIFVLGSSGEAAFLTDAQRRVTVETSVQAVGGRVPLLAGCIDMTTARVAEHVKVAQQAGADAVVVTAPFYAATHDSEIERHFRLVRDTAAVPVVAYDVPSSVHTKLSARTVLRLAEDAVITGVKDSSGDDAGLRDILMGRRSRLLDDFAVLTGSELLVDTALMMGADGAVPGLANVDPAGYVAIYDLIRSGNVGAALAEQERLVRLFGIIGVADRSRMGRSAAALGAFKAAMKLRGVIDNALLAPPQPPLNGEEIRRIECMLRDAGIPVRA